MAKFIVTTKQMVMVEKVFAIDALDEKEAIGLIERGRGIAEAIDEISMDDLSASELRRLKDGKIIYNVELD